MRVCILTRGDLFPTQHGAAVKIVRTAEALVAAGCPTVVVTDDRDRYFRVHGDGEWRPVPFPPRVRAAEEWPLIPRLGRAAERLLGRLGYPREEHFLYRPMFDPAWWLRAVAVGLAEDIDVFQAEFPGYGVPAWVASRLLGQLGAPAASPRAVVVQHNVEWDRLAEFGHDVRHIRRLEQLVLGRMDDVIAVSSDDRTRMVDAGLPAGAVSVIPHGVDLATFSGADGQGIRRRYDIAADAPLLFFHGTLHYWPNTEAVRFIAESLLPRLLAARPDLRVLICGMNPPRYYDHAAIHFSGPVDDLAAHIAAADLCLCPIDAGGGTRMKLLEYMAAGKAIVSSTKGAEGIQYSDGVELCVADGPAAFADTVLGLLADPARRAALGQAAQTFAARYDWLAIGRSYRALFQGDGRGDDFNTRLAASPSPIAAPPPPPIDAHLPADRVPSKPLTMLLLINRGCNLRCSFCDLWDDHQHMDVPSQLIPLLDEAVAIGTKTLVITGGEPLLHPDLVLAVREARARGLSVNITSNGLLVRRHLDALREAGVNSISVSIDGLSGTHDRLRRQAGAWELTMSALKAILATGDVSASVYFTVTRENVGELTAVYEQVRAMGAGFDFWPVNDAPELYLDDPHSRATFMAAVDHIGKRDPEVAARTSYYWEGLDYHRGKRGPVRCLGLVDQFGVRFDGELLPCCVWGGDGLAVGNVFQTPLRELWRSPEVVAARGRLWSEGCEVGCYNHSLYELEESTRQSFRVRRPVG